MWYELWDAETGNRVGRFPTEEAALGAVREDAERYGRASEAVTTLGLLLHDPSHAGGGLIAEGPALVERALANATTARSTANGAASARLRVKTPKR